jgi:hypothetical protein
MDKTKIVKLTNFVGIVSIGLLAYWVFIFVSITVFGFKIFRENITQVFYLSLFGILSLLSGAIVLNIMLNLTRIADYVSREEVQDVSKGKGGKLKGWIIAMSFPLIFVLLYAGDLSSSKRKETVLIDSGKSLIAEQSDVIDSLANYEFTKEYLENVSRKLSLLSKLDESFPEISVIVADKVDGKNVALRFRSYFHLNKDKTLDKIDYIYPTSKEERAYLNEVFSGKEEDVWFSAHDGNYELYYPVNTNKTKIVLYFSDRQRYGKFGS